VFVIFIIILETLDLQNLPLYGMFMDIESFLKEKEEEFRMPGWWPLVKPIFTLWYLYEGDNAGFSYKEKFGTLRLSVFPRDFEKLHASLEQYQEVLNMARKAQQASVHICMDCGAPGKLTRDFWVLTLCPKCVEKSKK
jgi:hypothetical protein